MSMTVDNVLPFATRYDIAALKAMAADPKSINGLKARHVGFCTRNELVTVESVDIVDVRGTVTAYDRTATLTGLGRAVLVAA